MHLGNQMVSGTTLRTNMADTRTVIVEVTCKVVLYSEIEMFPPPPKKKNKTFFRNMNIHHP